MSDLKNVPEEIVRLLAEKLEAVNSLPQREILSEMFLLAEKLDVKIEPVSEISSDPLDDDLVGFNVGGWGIDRWGAGPWVVFYPLEVMAEYSDALKSAGV